MVSPASLFLYEPRVVRIWSVSPNRGPTAGGTQIVIVGEGFSGLATGGPVVDLGGALASVTSFTDNQIVATTDAHVDETVDLSITNSDGDSATLAGGFDYHDGLPPIDLVFRTPVGGVARLARVESPPARVSQALGQPWQMTFSSPVEPNGFDPVSWTSFGQVLFEGLVVKTTARSEGRDKLGVWDCQCLNYTFLLAKRYPIGEWVQASASDVLQSLMSEYGQGFSSSIEPSLDLVTVKLVGSQDLWSVIVDICEKAGAKCFLAGTTLVVFTVSSSYDPPAPVTDANTDLCWPESGQAVSLELDYQPIANSVTVYGAEGIKATVEDAQSIASFGLCPLPIYDNALTTITECLERAQQVVEDQAFPVPTAKYSTRDLKTMAGKTVTISVSSPTIDDDFIIQNVEIDQLELLAVGKKPRFSVTAVPWWAPAMKRSEPTARLLQAASDIVAEQDKQPRLSGDITSEPGGRTTIPAGSISQEKLAGCIPGTHLLDHTVTSDQMSATGVAAGSKGDSSHLVSFDVDAAGRITGATVDPVPVVKTDGSQAWTADQSMGGNQITDVGTPSAGTDAANKTYVDTEDATFIKKDGSRAFTADQSLGAHKLTNVADPASAQDAATKAYVDAHGSNPAQFAVYISMRTP